jgi:inhibitor of cysteine peptidase
MLHLDESYSGREIELGAGEEFELRLHENPTTGFRWRLESDGEPACKLQSDFFETANGTPGRGGTHYWRFQAVQEGLGHIELVYRRSFEHDESSTQSFKLLVRVRA